MTSYIWTNTTPFQIIKKRNGTENVNVDHLSLDLQLFLKKRCAQKMKTNLLSRLVYFDLLVNILQSRFFWENISFWNSWRSNPPNVGKKTLLLVVCVFDSFDDDVDSLTLFQRVHIGHLTLLFSLFQLECMPQIRAVHRRKFSFPHCSCPRLDYDFDCLFFSSERRQKWKWFSDLFFFFSFPNNKSKEAIIVVARVHIPYFCFYYYFILQRLRHLNHGSIDFFFFLLFLSLFPFSSFLFFPPFASSSFFFSSYIWIMMISLSLLYTQ